MLDARMQTILDTCNPIISREGVAKKLIITVFSFTQIIGGTSTDSMQMLQSTKALSFC